MEGRNVGEEANGSVIESWLMKHGILYTGATRHPFILSIRDGTVQINSLKRWMAEDYIFVRAFVAFVASVLVTASKSSLESDIDVILEGLVSLRDEIAWFKKQAFEWDVSLADIVPQQITLNYCRFLESLMNSEVDYTVAITAFWAIETVYQNCFAHCVQDDGSQISPELKKAFERWGSDEFSQYCSELRIVADRCLEHAPDSVRTKAEVAFLDVLEREVEFWNMSNGHV